MINKTNCVTDVNVSGKRKVRLTSIHIDEENVI